jgi:hypothetical protein
MSEFFIALDAAHHNYGLIDPAVNRGTDIHLQGLDACLVRELGRYLRKEAHGCVAI